MLKKIFSALFLLFFIFKMQPLDLDYQTFKKDFFPADENSGQQKKLVDFLSTYFKSKKLQPVINMINGDDYTANSYNISLKFKGKKKERNNLLFIFPLNSNIIEHRLLDHSSSIMIALELIEEILTYSLNKDVEFIFSGANGRMQDECYGIKYFIQEYPADLALSFVTIIDINDLNQIILSGSDNERPIAREILQAFLSSRAIYPAIDFKADEILKSRFNFLKPYQKLTYFTEIETNCVIFTNDTKTAVTDRPIDPVQEAEKLEQLAQYFINWLLILDETQFDDKLDYNYTYFSLLGKSFFISEYIQILFFLILIISLLFIRFFIIYQHKIKIYLLIRTIPYYLLLFLLFYLLSLLPKLIFILTESILQIEDLLLNFPLLYFIAIFFIPLFIIFLLFEQITQLPFPKHNYLYIYGANLFINANLFICVIFEISILYIFLWAILLITISHLGGKNFILKYICYLIAAYPLAKLFYDLLLTNDLLLVEGAFNNPLSQHLIFCLMTYPFLLISIRIFLINKNKIKLLNSKLVHSLILVILIFSSLLTYLIISYQKSLKTEKLTVNMINNYLDHQFYLDIQAKQKISQLSITHQGMTQNYHFKTRQEQINLPFKPEKPYQLQIKPKKLINLKQYRLEMTNQVPAEYLAVTLICPKTISPINSNYRFYRKPDSDHKTAYNEVFEFLIPRNIGRQFDLMLNLIPGNHYRLIFKIQLPVFMANEMILSHKNQLNYQNTFYIDQIILAD